MKNTFDSSKCNILLVLSQGPAVKAGLRDMFFFSFLFFLKRKKIKEREEKNNNRQLIRKEQKWCVENIFHFNFRLWQFPLFGRKPVTSCLLTSFFPRNTGSLSVSISVSPQVPSPFTIVWVKSQKRALILQKLFSIKQH